MMINIQIAIKINGLNLIVFDGLVIPAPCIRHYRGIKYRYSEKVPQVLTINLEHI